MRKIKIVFIVFLLFLSFNFVQAQTPISDLVCEKGEAEGTIWLKWTVPSQIASSSAYELRYSQGNSIRYDSARIYNQNWLSGTPGTKKRELVKGLNPGTEFTFALKWKNELGEWSLPSNSKTCIAPTSSKIDNLAPELEIENLKSEDEIFEKEDFEIKGFAKDIGSSSVKKVEISFDGKNWEKCLSLENVEGKLFWKYSWKNPQLGDYKIFFRATDWLDNISEAKEIKIKVIAKKEIVEEKTKEPTLEKPVSEMTVEELQTKIKETQEKIIILLKQLIDLLSQKILELKK